MAVILSAKCYGTRAASPFHSISIFYMRFLNRHVLFRTLYYFIFFFLNFRLQRYMLQREVMSEGTCSFLQPSIYHLLPFMTTKLKCCPSQTQFYFYVKASVVAFGPVQWLQWCFAVSRLKCMTFVWCFKRRSANVLFWLYFPSKSLCHPLFFSSVYWWHIHPSILTSIHPKISGLFLAGHSPTSQCPSVCLFETYFEHNVLKKRVHPNIFFFWKENVVAFNIKLCHSLILNYEY